MRWGDAAEVWAGEEDKVRGRIPAQEAADAKQFWHIAIWIEGLYIFKTHFWKKSFKDRIHNFLFLLGNACVFSDSEKYYEVLKLLPSHPSSVTLLDVQKAFIPLDMWGKKRCFVANFKYGLTTKRL